MKISKIITVTFIFFISFYTIFAQRIVQSINTDWHFYKGDINQSNNLNIDWQVVNLPHTWNSQDVMDETPGYYRGIGLYKKDIFIPKSWNKKDVFLYFEGVNQETEVFINGTNVGKHLGGYTAFNFNITPFLNSGKNELQVKVNNAHNEDIPPLSADFTYYGWIYRDSYLIAVNSVHFKIDKYTSPGVFITTPTVTSEKASVHLRGSISGSTQNIILKTTLLDAEGLPVAEKQNTISKNGDFEVDFKNIKYPQLWSPELI